MSIVQNTVAGSSDRCKVLDDHPVARELRKDVTFFGPRGFKVEREALVLRHGRPFTGIERPKGFRRQWTRRACFGNAGILASEGRGTYCEGFIASKDRQGRPIHHAWITVDGVHAIDVTLSDANKHLYFGISFPHRQFMDLITPRWRKGYAVSILETVADVAEVGSMIDVEGVDVSH